MIQVRRPIEWFDFSQNLSNSESEIKGRRITNENLFPWFIFDETRL